MDKVVDTVLGGMEMQDAMQITGIIGGSIDCFAAVEQEITYVFST